MAGGGSLRMENPFRFVDLRSVNHDRVGDPLGDPRVLRRNSLLLQCSRISPIILLRLFLGVVFNSGSCWFHFRQFEVNSSLFSLNSLHSSAPKELEKRRIGEGAMAEEGENLSELDLLQCLIVWFEEKNWRGGHSRGR